MMIDYAVVVVAVGIALILLAMVLAMATTRTDYAKRVERRLSEGALGAFSVSPELKALNLLQAQSLQHSDTNSRMEKLIMGIREEVESLRADVARYHTVFAGATALINGFNEKLAKAIADAVAAGAPPDVIQSVVDVHAQFVADGDALAQAVSQNTPQPTGSVTTDPAPAPAP